MAVIDFCEKNNTLSTEDKKNVRKHLKKVRVKLYINLIRAYYGWWCWFWICRTRGFGNTAVVLLPGDDKEVSYYSLLYLNRMLDKRGYDNAIILTHESATIKAAPLFSDRILAIKRFSRRKAVALMQFYCLYDFNKQFICASLDEPYGRNGSALIGKKGTTKEEVFVMGIYKLKLDSRPEFPQYSGDDKEIINFIHLEDNLPDKLFYK